MQLVFDVSSFSLAACFTDTSCQTTIELSLPDDEALSTQQLQELLATNGKNGLATTKTGHSDFDTFKSSLWFCRVELGLGLFFGGLGQSARLFVFFSTVTARG
jgi:hypothetical protein